MAAHSARTYALEATDGDIEHMSDWGMSSDEDVLWQLEEDIITWLEYCEIAEHIVRDYLAPNIAHSANIDVYEQVGMFLYILAHGKGYRQVQTLFGHSLQTICHYFKKVFWACLAFNVNMVKPDPRYNKSTCHHHPNSECYPLFQDCIGAIDGTHVRAGTRVIVESCPELCIVRMSIFRFRRTKNITFVDLGFAHRPGYMAPYKGSDIRYHFQQFRDVGDGRRRRFQNARERFNFHHSSCRNVIERAFGVWKQRWKIFDWMPGYSMRTQTAVVVAMMGIHNFLRRNERMDEGFRRAEEVEDEEVEIELPDEEDEIAVERDAIAKDNVLWYALRDYMAHALR
ncbi:uncharacterized protein LOC111390218 [Olea europaea var. sylvestris]|uniref:uncharacterized protein LOC111390218 n=1 Tax=Olea europaea var. sylvestris TaxID=158386 RepID=UPI000C1D4ECE|nr:uncharacterized protein LOC111390218 [Olea europaea var. sylvestris]